MAKRKKSSRRPSKAARGKKARGGAKHNARNNFWASVLTAMFIAANLALAGLALHEGFTKHLDRGPAAAMSQKKKQQVKKADGSKKAVKSYKYHP